MVQVLLFDQHLSYDFPDYHRGKHSLHYCQHLKTQTQLTTFHLWRTLYSGCTTYHFILFVIPVAPVLIFYYP